MSAPNYPQAEAFLHALDPEADAFTFQTFDDNNDRRNPALAKIFNGSFERHREALATLNERGAGIYVTVNETDGEGRKKSNIVRVRAIWQEDDGDGKGQLPLEPHIVVNTSPGKYHRYWLVDGLAFEQFGGVMERMIVDYGSDPNAKDVSRVLRLPGFSHRKVNKGKGLVGEPYPVTVVEQNKLPPYCPAQLLEAFPPVERGSYSEGDGNPRRAVMEVDSETVEELRSALKYLDADGRARWIEIGLSLTCLGDVGRDLWWEWSESSAKHEPTADRKKWCELMRNSEHRSTYKKIFALAQEGGWANPMKGKSDNAASEDYLASRFSERHAGSLRYVAKWNRWYRWDGSRWIEDSTLAVFDLVRGSCRAEAERLDKPDKKMLGRATTVASVERLAKADRRHAATIGQWDADEWALNTPDGIVDLRTGEMTPHSPDAYMTKMTSVAPRGECALWLEFLQRVTDGDNELIAYLQRWLGYCLTGSVREHVFLFLFGSGRNGKGVFINTVGGIFGEYHQTSPVETFQASNNDRHPTELALLMSARLVSAQETENGRRWAESRIKALTGGDPIVARFMRADFFTFEPAFKLMVAGNHRPHLTNVDPAMKARLHVVPFDVFIRSEQRDPELQNKLCLEQAGILAWLIEGCLAWQSEGLNPPARVVDATGNYFEDEDSVSAWFDECCERDATHFADNPVLWRSWNFWCGNNGENPGTRKALAQKLIALGFSGDKERGVRGFRGFRMKDCVSAPKACA